MRIFYGKGAYRRANGNLPELKLINMYVEPSAVDEEGVVLLSRQGLAAVTSLGGEIRGVFYEDDVFNGDDFIVSGTTLYRGFSRVGEIDGNGPVSFAASGTELAICAGESLWRYDGMALSKVSFPDGANVRKILYHDGLFLAIRDDTAEVYASGVLDLTTWDALSFKSAESSPDNLLDAEFLSDALYLFGTDTIEPWDNDGSGDTVPYTRRELSVIKKGIRDTGCLVVMDQALWFVSNLNTAMVIRGGAPERVSDHGIEERIGASASCSCFAFVKDGHSFFCIRLDGGTFAYDFATQEWCEFQTSGLSNFVVQCASGPIEPPVFGGSDGKIYQYLGEQWTDGSYPLERRFTAGVPLSGGTLSIDVLSIEANTGWTPSLSGQGASPQVEVRTSRDGGATWGTWRQAPLGAQGKFRTRSRWRRLGLFDEPGALFDIRTADPVGFRVSGVFVNESGGGRSRG